MSRHRMAPSDAAWWHMNREVNQMVVTSVMWFDEPVDPDAVRAILRDRLIATYPRFSQRIVETPRGVWWEDVGVDADALLADHLVLTALPAPGGIAELQAYVSALAGRPLAPDRPPWEAHLVSNLRGSGCAIVTRIHHCVADGIALARVLLSLTDDPAAADSAGIDATPPSPSSRLAGATRAAGGLLGDLLGDLVHPGRWRSDVVDAAAVTREVARLVGLPPDHRTALRGRLGTEKSTVWSEPIPLQQLRTRARANGTTVNDLMLAALSGALRDHLAWADGRARDIRVIMPINLRPLDEPLPPTLGNAFGLLFLSLPVGVDDPTARLEEVHRRTEALKSSPEPLVSYRILELTGLTPYPVQQLFVELFTIKASGVVTNVPGPRTPVFLAGRKLRGMVAWPPESGNLGLGVSLISYDGEVVIGLLTDDHLLPEPRRLLHHLVDELTGRTATAPAASKATSR